MSDSPNLYTILTNVKEFLSDRFNFDDDKASEQDTIDEIKKSVVFKGTNLWILIFAIMVASIGLNVNSTAVIIGAMLISPLMGPIMGIGLGVGIFDIELISKSLRNLIIAVIISVLTSALYFWISPLNDAQSELLARTSPTLWDVLIALFGGLAGIVAGSRQEKSNAIPGVAIATALMPPLCTAGYGLATGQWSYFFGAFYLFFINSVFISFSTYLIVRVLNFKQKEFVNPTREKRIKQYIYLLIIMTVVPSIYTGYQVVKDNLFDRRVNNFINQEFNFEKTKVIARDIIRGDSTMVDVTLYGEPISEEIIKQIKGKLTLYHLDNTGLRVRQGYSGEAVVQMPNIELINQQMRTGIIEELYKKNEEVLESKDKQIALLEEELLRLQKNELPKIDISAELIAINPNVEEFSISNALVTNFIDSIRYDTTHLAYIKFSKKPVRKEKKQLENWLRARTGNSKIRVIAQ